MTMKPTTRGFLFLAFVLAVLPLALPNAYYYDLAIRIAINASIAVGLNRFDNSSPINTTGIYWSASTGLISAS